MRAQRAGCPLIDLDPIEKKRCQRRMALPEAGSPWNLWGYTVGAEASNLRRRESAPGIPHGLQRPKNMGTQDTDSGLSHKPFPSNGLGLHKVPSPDPPFAFPTPPSPSPLTPPLLSR